MWHHTSLLLNLKNQKTMAIGRTRMITHGNKLCPWKTFSFENIEMEKNQVLTHIKLMFLMLMFVNEMLMYTVFSGTILIYNKVPLWTLKPRL